MKKLLFTIIVVLLSGFPGFAGAEGGALRIAFGSCNRAELEQPLWDVIRQNSPDVFIWTGDNVYAKDKDIKDLAEQYRLQKARPDYQKFSGQTRVMAVWDDHDYGLNDGGRFFRHKKQSQRLFLDFVGAPVDDARRAREGIYDSQTLEAGGLRVKIILLDTRYHRDDPGKDGDVLGKEQWQWLEGELAGSQADVHLIVSSIQVLASEHKYEKWANFPSAKRRLFDLLARLKVPGVIFISGDRHLAEISRCDDCVGYPLYDITSSGLTHSWGEFKGEPNRLRQGEVFSDLNFGLVTIEAAGPLPGVALEIRDKDNAVRLREIVQFAGPKP